MGQGGGGEIRQLRSTVATKGNIIWSRVCVHVCLELTHLSALYLTTMLCLQLNIFCSLWIEFRVKHVSTVLVVCACVNTTYEVHLRNIPKLDVNCQ